MRFTIMLCLLLLGISTATGSECKNRGSLAINYCDNDNDLIADAPENPAEWVNPRILIVSFAPFGNYVTASTLFNPFIQHLESCLQRRVIFYPMQSNEAEIAAMHSGRLHIAGFSTGSLVTAVNQAGAVPFATQGDEEGIVGANLIVIVRTDSPYQTLSDLKNRRVIHSSSTSLTGHLATFTLFPKEGLTPGVDYKIMFSGQHNRSIAGVKSGDYDAATTTTEVLNHMIQHQEVNPNDFRIIYRSQIFPSAAFTYAHNLDPDLKKQIQSCFMQHQFSKAAEQVFPQGKFFVPVNYHIDWDEIRQILDNIPPSP